MNQLPNLNATITKEVFYNASLAPGATQVNFTVENCHLNAFIQQIVFYLSAPQSNFAQGLSITINDRGNSYPSQINGLNPISFATISTSPTIFPANQSIPSLIIQNGNTIVVDVLQSVEDAEGLGNIYIQANNGNGFNVSFTMAVVYRPESTYNGKLNTRVQTSNDKPIRVLQQLGTGAFNTCPLVDQTNFIAKNFNPRNNVDIATFGFNVTTTNPIFYFGTPYKTKRWFIGFSSDCTPNLGIITFSYFNGTGFTSFLPSQYYLGALGPGTYQFAYDGVVIFNAPSGWINTSLPNDPNTLFNQTIIGLGTLATNELVNNPGFSWIQCQVGFGAGLNTSLTVSTVVPLIDPALPLTYRRRLI